MLETFKEVLTNVNSYIALGTPILTILGLCIPKVRKWLKHAIQNLIGLPELQKKVAAIEENQVKMSKELKSTNDKLDMHLDKDEEKMQAQMVSLKDSLMRSFHYYTERGYITLDELAELQDVYTSYRKFKGNGLFKAKWENVILKLPNEPLDENTNQKN